MPELPLDSFCTGALEIFVALLDLCRGRGEETVLFPGKETFWKLEQPSAVHLRSFGHFWQECCQFGHKKQKFLSAMTSALCAGVFPRNTKQRHSDCVSLQSIHLTGFDGRQLHLTVVASALDVGANKFLAVFIFVVA